MGLQALRDWLSRRLARDLLADQHLGGACERCDRPMTAGAFLPVDRHTACAYKRLDYDGATGFGLIGRRCLGAAYPLDPTDARLPRVPKSLGQGGPTACDRCCFVLGGLAKAVAATTKDSATTAKRGNKIAT